MADKVNIGVIVSFMNYIAWLFGVTKMKNFFYKN